jgi:hypothetical protein
MSSSNTAVGSVEYCDEEERPSELGMKERASLNPGPREVVSDNDNIIVENNKSDRCMTFMSALAPHQKRLFLLTRLNPTRQEMRGS